MTVSGITGINLPALEKRFQFTSKDLGLIAASNDLSAILLICFVSFYGQFGNKIKWLGYGAMITGECAWVNVFANKIRERITISYGYCGHSVTEVCFPNVRTALRISAVHPITLLKLDIKGLCFAAVGLRTRYISSFSLTVAVCSQRLVALCSPFLKLLSGHINLHWKTRQ